MPRLTELAVAVGLEGDELDAELASVHQQRASLAAYEAGLIERKATLGAAHPLPFLPGARTDVRASRPTTDEDPALQAADDFLPDEVAVLLNMSVPSTRHHVDHALTLVRQLPAVWHALADRRIDETRAKVIVKALGYQATSHGGPVPDAVIDDIAALGVAWAARGCAPTTLRERLDTALITADPAAADRRRELRTRTADVTVQGTGDSLAELRASQMDAADAKLVRAQLDAYARRIKADGDPRPIGAIRVAVLAALVARPWEKQDPAIAHLTINADLTDLLPDLITAGDQPTAHDPADDHPGDNEPTRANEPDDHQPTAHEPAADTVARNEPTEHDLTDTAETPDLGEATEATEAGARASKAGAAERGATETGGTGTRATRSDATGPEPTSGEALAHHLASDAATDEATGTAGRSSPTDPPPPAERVRAAQPPPGPAPTDHTWPRPGSAGAGRIGGVPISPAAVRALLQHIDALGLTDPQNGNLSYTLTGQGGRLLAVATPDELTAAARTGRGLGPPGPAPGYTPTAAQYRYLRARDRHCRFPGCRQVALTCDADHVIPYDHQRPALGGRTCVTNLVMLCRHHHRLKTHARGWAFHLDPDGTLHVTTPGGTTRTTRPPAADQVLDLTADPPPAYDPADDPPPF